jgi:hypothetical protein
MMPEEEALGPAVGGLLLGDHRHLQELAAHPAAFRGKNGELLEHLASPLRESNRIEDALDALERGGRPDLADLLLRLARDDAFETDRRRPWASVECMRRQDAGKPECVDLFIERIPVKAARQLARSAVRLGASVSERRRT